MQHFIKNPTKYTSIAEKYLELVYKLAEIKIVEVSSAVELSETQESNLRAKISFNKSA